MNSGGSGRKVVLTYEDYVTLPNDGRRYEILEGELAVTPAPSPKHQAVLGHLFVLLYGFVVPSGMGRVFVAPIDVILSATTVVQPDLVYVARERENLITQRGIEGPPDLVVEILSSTTSRADRTTKLQLYGRHGVQHYLLIDPDAETLEACRLEGGAYTVTAALSGSVTFEPSWLPGFRLPLEVLWR